MLDVVRVVLVVLRTSSMWWVDASSLGMCLAAGAGAAACACACSIRDMERVTGLFTCVDNDSARSRRRARAWRAAREAGFACFVSGGGGGGSEEKTDHIVGRLRGQEGGVDGRVEEGLRRKDPKRLAQVQLLAGCHKTRPLSTRDCAAVV